jgi:NDP-sugar pyrophosphorylase family protein
MRAIILAGGKGTRLQPYTTVLPKPLMPIGDVPVLDIILRQLSLHGFQHVTIAAGYLSEIIRAYLHDDRRYNLKIDFSVEEMPLGTVGPLSLISDLDETFLVMNGDILTTLDYTKLLSFHKSNNAVMTAAVHRRSIQVDFGVVEISENGEILNHTEKPTVDYFVGMGICVCEPEILKYIEKGTRFDFPDLFRKLISEREKIIGYLSDDYWLDIGRKDDYEKAIDDYEKMKQEFFRKDL